MFEDQNTSERKQQVENITIEGLKFLFKFIADRHADSSIRMTILTNIAVNILRIAADNVIDINLLESFKKETLEILSYVFENAEQTLKKKMN
jgi:hypothetical protein